MATTDEKETYFAIKRMRFQGLSEGRIAESIGKSRSYVQRRVWLMRMPDATVDKWLDGKINDRELAALAKANKADNFSAVWSDFQAGMDITTKPDEEPKSKDGVLRTVLQVRLMAERKSLTKSARNALLWVLCERDTI